MAVGLITKRAVNAVQPGSTASFLWDSEVKGFGLKVTPSGSRSYIYQYRLGGRGAKVRRFSIGAHGAWTPDAARREARRLAQLVDQGRDPAAAAAVRKRETVDLAFPAYAERFITEYIRREWIGGQELAAGILRRDLIPALRGRTIREITRADVSSVMDKLADRPAVRRNAFAILRRLFGWAVNRGDLETSLLRSMEAPPAPESRDRVLSDAEVASVWVAAERMGYPFGPLIRLLLLTGQRREEVAGLNWNELDRAQALWTIPARRAKNRVKHHVPLSDLVRETLDGVAEALGHSSKNEWPQDGIVFSSNGSAKVSGYSAAKRRIDRIIGEIDGTEPAPWRIHDLRRTLATGLQRLSTRFEVTEAVLNHVSGSRSGIAGVYQRHHWSEEKRSALEAWSQYVQAVIASSAVSG